MADLPPGHTMYVICGVYTKAMVSATGSPNCVTTVYVPSHRVFWLMIRTKTAFVPLPSFFLPFQLNSFPRFLISPHCLPLFTNERDSPIFYIPLIFVLKNMVTNGPGKTKPTG